MLAKLQLRFANLFGNFATPKKKKVIPRIIDRTSSDLELKKIWEKLCSDFFPENNNLLNYQIIWSIRSQKRTLASCNIQKHRIVVARELNYPEHQKWLEPLIYHEMCHAVLGLDVKKNNNRRAWHGADFKRLEKRHPLMNEFEYWTKSGGWITAVRSDRGKRVAAKRFKKQGIRSS